ncbi:MAG: Hsp20/alpha crystallin family protein [Promethearchaeota archaeon]
MSEIKEKEKTTEIENSTERSSKLLAYPQICAFTDEDATGYNIEIYLPGVEKDTIKLEMDEDYVSVVGETDTVRYRGLYGLCCPVEPEKATSTYKEGLLKIYVPFKEVEMHKIDVKIE